MGMSETMSRAAGKRRPWPWALSLILLGLAERAAMWRFYAPVAYGDSPSYMRLAEALERGFPRGYDGTRVPGYPAFLMALGQQERSVWLAQMALGVIISLLLFWIGWRSLRSPTAGFATGMLYNLLPGPLLFEANLLSETLAGFGLALTFALYLALEETAGRTPWAYALALLLGVAAALSGLVRALFYFLPVWLFPFVWLAGEGNWKPRLARAAVFSCVPVLLLGGWIGFIYASYDMLSPTTMGGYHLVQHTGEWFEYLPDEHATIRDVYLAYRDAQIAEKGNQTNAIWDAIPELSQKTGLSFFALSARLQELSLQLIVDHPLLYLRNVVEGWVNFWRAPVYWRAEAMHPALRGAVRVWALAGRGVELLANAAFLVLSALAIFRPTLRRRLRPSRFVVAVAGFVWMASLIQTLVDHGDNPRFLVPLQIFVVYVVVWGAWRWWRSRSPAKPG